MDQKGNFKLFGVEIAVSTPSSSEYSSIPTVHHDDQNNNNVAANYDVLTTLLFSARRTQNPCSEVSRKSPKRAFDEIHDCNNNNINGGDVCNVNLLPFKKRFSFKTATIFPTTAQVGCTRGAIINGQTLLRPTVQLSTDGRPCADDDVVSRNSRSTKQYSFDEIQDPWITSPPSTSDGAILDDTKVYSPEPLRCYFPPTDMIFSASSELGSSRNIKPCQEKKNKAAKSNENKKKKKEKSLGKSRGTLDKSIPPVVPLEEIPGLMETIGSQNGSTKPVFLYKKELKESDVKPHLNRLFVSGNDKQLYEFLTEEEKAAVSTDKARQGLQFVGIDKQGKSYNLRMKNWGSLTIIAIIKEWTTMVKANNAQKGDWVELWGYRVHNNEFRLVVNFRK